MANPGLYWINNDSGDTRPRVRGERVRGHPAHLQLTGATAIDWEDIEIGGGPVAGRPVPLHRRHRRQLGEPVGDRRLPGARADRRDGDHHGALAGVEALHLRYPDGAHNAESLIADPVTGELMIIAKSSNGGPTNVYVAPAGLVAGSLTVMTRVATL